MLAMLESSIPPAEGPCVRADVKPVRPCEFAWGISDVADSAAPRAPRWLAANCDGDSRWQGRADHTHHPRKSGSHDVVQAWPEIQRIACQKSFFAVRLRVPQNLGQM